MNKLITVLFILIAQLADGQGYKDTLICKDTTYSICKTVQIPIIIPPSEVTVRGMYGHPDQVTIGNATSEHQFLLRLAEYGCNELNMYCRSYLYTETKRIQLANFVRRAKESYGITTVTVDVRLTNTQELPGWKAYFQKYSGTISMIEPLTEFEPYVKNSSGVYDYPGFFNLVRTMGILCDQYNVKMRFYEGWIGNNYLNPQAAVDSMVKYCDLIYVSNYVTTADYNSTSTSLGAWDNRMDKRCNMIAISSKKFNKVTDIVEIVSLEPEMLGAIYTCPATTINKCRSFYGSLYNKAVTEYNKSTSDILQWTNLIGRTMFYSKYAFQAQPYTTITQ